MSPKEALEFAKQKEARQFDLRFTDLPGLSQHVSYPMSSARRRFLRGRLRNRRIEYPRLGGHQRERYAAHSGPQHGLHGSVRRHSHAGHDVRCHRSDHATALRARSALDREESRDVLEEQRARRYRLLRRRSRVLHLRQHPLRSEPALRLLFHRRRRRALEFGPREGQPRLPAALQGRLLPGRRRPIIIRICAPRWCRR